MCMAKGIYGIDVLFHPPPAPLIRLRCLDAITTEKLT